MIVMIMMMMMMMTMMVTMMMLDHNYDEDDEDVVKVWEEFVREYKRSGQLLVELGSGSSTSSSSSSSNVMEMNNPIIPNKYKTCTCK